MCVWVLTILIVPRVENFLNDVVNSGGERNTQLYSVATKTTLVLRTLFDILLLWQFLHGFGYIVQQQTRSFMDDALKYWQGNF